MPNIKTRNKRKHKDKKQKKKQHKRETKKRAKGINKSEPPRRAQKQTFKRVFSPRCKIYHKDKRKQAERTKSGKKPFLHYTRVS